mmetsp:Transcript_1102/g.1684  ORF Transcript_1102/g.1684 Transcript_1102/m.1684 type:complete len:152 (+) Transcript_1102:359-814(+)
MLCLRTLLQSNMKESTEGNVTVPQSHEVVLAMVKFLYSGVLPPDVPVKTLLNLAALADYYQLSELRDLCTIILCRELKADNCIAVFRCGVSLGNNMLTIFAAHCMLENFNVVLVSEQYAYLLLDKDLQKAFLVHMPQSGNEFTKKRKREYV